MWSRSFWKAAVERMVRGFAIAALAVLGSQAADAFRIDWLNVLSFGAGGAVLSLLLSLAGNAATGNGPSFTQTEVVAPAAEVQPAEEEAPAVIYPNAGGPPHPDEYVLTRGEGDEDEQLHKPERLQPEE